MTRPLFFALSLAVALAGCPSSPSTTDAGGRSDVPEAVDTGGGGVDAPAEVDTGVPGTDTGIPTTDAPSAGGTCTNAADMAALETADVEGAAGDCAMDCLGQPAGDARIMCINDCIQDPTHLNGAVSSACTRCFAAAADCTIDSCLVQCIGGPTAPACVMCQCDNCAADYEACSGLDDTRCP